MKQNNSPWLTQLDKGRPHMSLVGEASIDVVIIGGGIAGVTTLYFLLKHTNKNVMLIEGSRIGHGATGHNAGQVVAEFERPLLSLVHEHGMKKAIEGFRMMEHAWDLAAEIMEDTKLDVPFKEFIGYGGYCELQQLMVDLDTELLKNQNGLVTFPILVSRQSGWIQDIPEKYREICTEVDAGSIKELLGTTKAGYHAALPEKKGTMNSALFSEKLAMWCLEHYKSRVQIFEGSFVHGVELDGDTPKVITNQATVNASEIVLCTNGFESFYIKDKQGMEIDTKFHHLIQGKVGYMTAYLTDQELHPMANFYYEEGKVRSADTFHSDPYIYVTRRAFAGDEHGTHLMAIGGPEAHLVEREIYFREYDVNQKFKDDADLFAKKHYDMSPFKDTFFWHGLMGYTRTGLRVVGREPLDTRLMYNLGCNGVGILPSIMGARKIARHVNGEPVEETIFDPKR